jgi:CHAT domain-containing protein/tetratricopeptide (TPR) repeat protein
MRGTIPFGRLAAAMVERALEALAAVAAALVFGAAWPRVAAAAPDPTMAAAQAWRAGDYARAYELALPALDHSSRPFATHRFVAEMARDAGRLDAAKVVLREHARRRGTDAAAAECALGWVALWENDFRGAIPRFERATALAPEEIDPFLGLTEAHLALGDRTLAWLDGLRTRHGYHWPEITARAIVLDATGRAREALPLFEEAARAAPEEAEIPYRAGIAAARLGRHTDGEASFDRAARLVRTRPDPTPAAHRLLAAIELERGRMAFETARFPRATEIAARAHERALEAANTPLLARTLVLEGQIRGVDANLEAAQRPATEALRLARRIGDDQIERDALGTLAALELDLFETGIASSRLKTALGRAAATGDSRGLESTFALLGLTAMARGEYLEAQTYFNEAAMRASAAGNVIVQQMALEGAARTKLSLSDHWQALELATTALALAEGIDFATGECQAHLTSGRTAYQLGLYDRAQIHLGRAADLAEKHGLIRQRGRTFLDLGRVAAALGEADVAQSWFTEALALAERTHDPALQTDCLSALGDGFLELGAYDAALHQYERAMTLATEAGYLEGRLANMTRAAEVLKLLGDVRRSVALLREGLRLSQALRNRVSQATNVAYLGENYAALGDYEKSLSYLNRSLSLNRETGSILGQGETLISICRTFNAAGSHAAAVNRCAEALAFSEEHGNEAQRARASIEMGNAYAALGHPERAEPYFRSSHALARSLDRPNIEWPAAAGMARVLAAQGRNEPAIQMGREAVATLEKLRSDIPLPEMRAGFLEDKLEPYEQLVLLLIRQGQLAEAFRTMEYSRSRTLLELLTDEPADTDPRLAELRRKNLALRRDILRRTEDLAGLPASADRDSATTALLSTLHDLRKQHAALKAEITRAFPEAGAAGAEPLTLDAVQRSLDPRTALLEYYVTRKELVIFVITQDGVRAVTRPESESQLASRARLLAAALASDPAGASGARAGAASWQPPAAALTQALIDPVRHDPLLSGKSDLVIVPHKFLHQVPFQALGGGAAGGTGAGAGASGAGGRPRYLIEDYLVSYAPSASVLKHCLDQDRGRKRSLLAVANPTPRNMQGQELPYVTDEVQSIKRSFDGQALVRIGREATETAVKREAGRADLLHIATHYDVNKKDPLRSALDLAPSAEDDGRLEVGEVMDLGLGADLVVLSGCSTAAAGGAVDGEPASDDWFGLTRAFLHAGAPSVVATLWPVNDRSTARFMERFYELLPVADKSTALARTQREMLAGEIAGAPECSAPYYWAPFVLIGSGE